LFVLGSLFAVAPSSSAGGAPICGTDRWAVKTLSDSFAEHVDLADVTPTTVAALNALPSKGWTHPERRHPPEETTVYEVQGIVRHVKGEADRDVHIVLEDPVASGVTMIVEVVDPACSGASDSPHLRALEAARTMMVALLRTGRPRDPKPLLGRLVKVRGVGFYDFDHGQTGRAQSNLELHPVLAIEALD
jgi:hypothetical protein